MRKDTALKIQKLAIGLFKEKGYTNVTIDEICKASEITKNTFYYYYKSKDQLLADFYENAGELSPEIVCLIAASENNWEKLWACLEPTFDWAIEAGPVIMSQVVITSIQKGHSIFSWSNIAGLDDVYIEIIKKGQKNGQFRNQSDAGMIYKNIQSAILGITVEWCIENGGFDKKQAVRDCLLTLLSVEENSF